MLGLVVGLALLADPLSTPLLTPELTVDDSLTQETILSAWRYELSLEPELEALADCESDFNEKAVNQQDSDGFKKYGLFQYHVPTWEWFVSMMRKDGLIEEDRIMNILSGADQILVTRWAMNNGYASHWGVCL